MNKQWKELVIFAFAMLLIADGCGPGATPMPSAVPPDTPQAPLPTRSSPPTLSASASSIPTSGATAIPTTSNLTLVPPLAVSLCETAFSSPVTAGSAQTPVRTLVNREYEGKGWDFDPNVMLTPHGEFLSPSEVHTLVCIRESRMQEITYPDGAAGFRLVWDVRLVLYPKGNVIGAQTFKGDPPPDARLWETMKKFLQPPAYGDRAEGSLLEWLFPFLNDRTVFCHGSSIYAVALAPDGKTLIAGGSGNSVKLWDVATGKALRSLTPSKDLIIVRAFALSPDGKTLALPGDPVNPQEPIQLWDITTGKVLLSFSTDEFLDVSSLAFSPDGKLLASGDWDGTVYLWDVASGKLLRALKGHTQDTVSLAFSPDGRSLASGSFDTTVKLWDVSTGKTLRTLTGHTDFVNGVAFSPNGQMLASASLDRTVRLWGVATGSTLQTITGEDHMTSVAFSPDGRTLASADVRLVKLWDVATGKLLRVLEGHAKSVESLAFSPDGKRLASGSIDTTIKMWDIASNP